MTRAVRGAIQIAENSAGFIEKGATRLVLAVLQANSIVENQLVSIIFSLTHDLTASNPATGLRRGGFSSTPLFCLQEARTDGAMARVIRVLVTWETRARRPAVPVYLDGAAALRPDLGSEDPV